MRAKVLYHASWMAFLQGQAAWAARVWGAAEALRETYGLARLDTFTLPYQLLLERAAHECYERALASARAQLGEAAFAAAWAEGRSMTLKQVLSANGPVTMPPLTRQAAKNAFGGLTEREREVVALIAQGKSNRSIAALLVVSERTVEAHVSNILAKLDLTSRTQIAVWAVKKGLANT